MSIAMTDTSVVTDTDITTPSRPHGLLSATHAVQIASPEWIYGGFDVETVCGGVGTSTAFCLPEGQPPTDKAPFANEWPHLTPLAVYALHECSSIGKEWASREADARKALEIGEQTALEEFFYGLAAVGAETAPAAASIAEALFAAEDLAGYEAGRVIHLTPSNALRLSEYLTDTDGRLTTKIGTPVVVGLGYVGNLNGVLVTGTPLAVEGGTVVTDTVLERPTNLVSVLAEKPYALGYACGATLIDVTTTP